MTWLEVIDSAIKIGLGALIAGASALLLSHSQYRRDLSKAKVEREFQILKEVAEQTERFTQVALWYWSLVADYHRLKRQGMPLSATKDAGLAKSTKALFNIFHELTSSEAKLLLLGKRDAQIALRTYGDMVIAFRRDTMQRSELKTDSEIDAWRTNILKTREKLLNELHASYRQLGR